MAKKTKQPRRQKKTFEEWLDHATPHVVQACGIGAININFYKAKKDVKSQIGGGSVVFSIKYDKSYKKAYINYYPVAEDLYKKERMHDLFDALTHEICHIITYPLHDLAETRCVTHNQIVEAGEEATESVGIILRKLLRLTKPELLNVAKEKNDIKQRSKKV